MLRDEDYPWLDEDQLSLVVDILRGAYDKASLPRELFERLISTLHVTREQLETYKARWDKAFNRGWDLAMNSKLEESKIIQELANALEMADRYFSLQPFARKLRDYNSEQVETALRKAGRRP